MTRLERHHFESLYASDPDPWGFETSDYERAKYARTLDALGPGPFASGLEIGCSIGVFTSLLATRCKSLLAVDISRLAVERARLRLGDRDNVQLEVRSLPEEMPAGSFDVVVCSEILYYWDRELLASAVPMLDESVAPGGVLVAVHWRKPTRTYPLLGDEAHELLSLHTSLVHTAGCVQDEYRLDRYEKAAA